MSDTRNRKVTLVGAGLGGALMASHLGQAGYKVDVYEQRSDPRGGPLSGGKSINLAISTRGLYALEKVGLKDEVLQIAVPMKGRMIHARNRSLTFQPYGTAVDDVINSVSRGRLNLMLIEAADRLDNVQFFFGSRCTGIELDAGRMEFHQAGTDQVRQADADFIVGADGAFSVVRRSMQRIQRFNFSQEYLQHGYKELSIPPSADGRHAMDENALHIWPRRAFMMIALPNVDGSFTCTLFFPFEGTRSFAALETDGDVRRFFEDEFPDAVPLMPTLLDDFRDNPTSSLVTVRCGPWYWRDKTVLLGDACHAVVPFYGQGANAAFEDCADLGELLAHGGQDLPSVFHSYYQKRKKHVDTLANLALHNFIEMRDHTGSRVFLMRKKLEKSIHRLFPKSFLPLYSMVTFSCIPYQDAVDRAERQWAVVRVVGCAVFMALLMGLLLLLKSLG